MLSLDLTVDRTWDQSSGSSIEVDGTGLIPGPVWLACRLLPKWYRTWDQSSPVVVDVPRLVAL